MLSARLLTLGLTLGQRSVLSTRAAAAAVMVLRVTTTTDTLDAETKILTAIEALGGKSVVREEIESYYCMHSPSTLCPVSHAIFQSLTSSRMSRVPYTGWEGEVQNDDEKRVAFTTERPLEDVLSLIGSSHNYDVPMIIADTSKPTAHWRGSITAGGDAASLAQTLARSRLVACAQITPDGNVAIKTTAKAKAAVEALAPSPVEWVPIVGNQPYLDWLDTETREAVERASREQACRAE